MMSYCSFNIFKSLTNVIGSHETYIIVWGLKFKIVSIASLFKPALGGSIITASGLIFNFFDSLPASPHINSILFMLLRRW